MIRKDIALDTDRPHYYSQYWIDVAAGKPSGSQVSAAPVESEPEVFLAEPEPVVDMPPARPPRVTKPKEEPKKAAAITSFQDLAKIDTLMKSSAEMDTDSLVDIDSAVSAPDQLEDVIVTDYDPSGAEIVDEAALPAGEPDLDGEEFEDEDEWGEDSDQPRRGSKPAKRQRREQRRDF